MTKGGAVNKGGVVNSKGVGMKHMKKYVIGAVALGLMAAGVAMPANASSDVVFNENCEVVAASPAFPGVSAVGEPTVEVLVQEYVPGIPAQEVRTPYDAVTKSVWEYKSVLGKKVWLDNGDEYLYSEGYWAPVYYRTGHQKQETVTPAGETVSYTDAVPEVAEVYETQPNPDYVAAIPAVAAVEGNDCNRLFVQWATSWGSDKPEPNHDEAFITDQTLVNGETCGVWVQTDFYPYGNERERVKTDEILSDGVLNKGEDYNWSEDWAFVKAADCVVPVDPPVVPEEPVAPTPGPVVLTPEPVESEKTVTANLPAPAEEHQALAATGVDVPLFAGVVGFLSLLGGGVLYYARRRTI